MSQARFAYRALQADGSIASGQIEASNAAAALGTLRGKGLRPIGVSVVATTVSARPVKASAAIRRGMVNFSTELATLLRAGLPLDRSLALAIANIEERGLARELGELLDEVKQGQPLSHAMARRPTLFSASAAAMAEAGEANGTLGEALARIGAALEREQELRQLIGNAMIYPIALAGIAVGVIAMMLLFVVPQFESLFAQSADKLPAASRTIMAASRLLREHGLFLLAGLVLVLFALRQLLRQDAVKASWDRSALRLPLLGELLRCVDAARFSRTLGALVDGNVALPAALALSRRTITNRTIGAAIERVAAGVREGSGLAGPLAAANVLPPVAIGFIRTGEESSQLGPMLGRLADVLDRDVKDRLQKLIGIATPLITIILGATVAAIIAAIMSAIIGFNDLALAT